MLNGTLETTLSEFCIKAIEKLCSSIEELTNGRYKVKMNLTDQSGEVIDLALTVSSLSEAEKIRENFKTRPESVYRGVFFSATGRIDYITVSK